MLRPTNISTSVSVSVQSPTEEDIKQMLEQDLPALIHWPNQEREYTPLEPLDADNINSIRKENPILKEAWENTKYGGVFNDRRPKYDYFNKMTTLQARKQMYQKQEADIHYLKAKHLRFKRLERSIKNMLELHSVTLLECNDQLENVLRLEYENVKLERKLLQEKIDTNEVKSTKLQKEIRKELKRNYETLKETYEEGEEADQDEPEVDEMSISPPPPKRRRLDDNSENN